MDANDKIVSIIIRSADRTNPNVNSGQYTVMIPGIYDLASSDCDLYECFLDAIVPTYTTGTGKGMSIALTGYFEIGFSFSAPYKFNSERSNGMFIVPSDTTSASISVFNSQNPVVVTKQSLLGQIDVTIRNDLGNIIVPPIGGNHVIKLTFKPLRLTKMSDLRI